MQELKGLNTTDFYSRFFVETALESHVSASAEQIKQLASIGEKFLTRYHSVHKTTSNEELFEHQSWFHSEILVKLGYPNLESSFYRTNGSKGIPVRGKLELLDGEELWIVEGQFGISQKESEPLQEVPHCSILKTLDVATSELQIDKSCDYQKLFRNILADNTNKCAWILFLAGEKMYLFERTKTLEMGAFLEVNWPEVFSNKDNKVVKAIIGLFGFEAFKVVNGDIAHNQLAETAHREAHGVTKSLKYSVRDALELLINEALYYHRNISPSETLTLLEKNSTNDEIAKILADEGLRYLYRLLFLFFVESRGRESEILPIKSKGYSLGYSLENIRNLELKRAYGSKSGRYIQETLDKTFSIMFYGVELNRDDSEKLFSSGFECPRIGTLLFDPKKTTILNEVILRDQVMKEVISKLSISEMGKGKNKKMARISYANLGLNQLGAVYEGLLSLKPVITDNEYCTAVLGTQDDEFLIPKADVKKFEKEQIKSDESGKPIIHKKGEFLFRTMGYERKYSASFYTDETLTKCLVKECLEEHFKDDSGKPSCQKIEEMKILEPAMGSGAFLNETANQLAVYYTDALVRENRNFKSVEIVENGKKLVKKIEKERIEIINEAKEFIMRNCLYGVDLNPMATELAKVSLWLNCVNKNGSFTFHDFKIRRGNSLVGAFVRQKAHFSNDIHHFLVPLPQMLDIYIDALELGDKKRPFFSEKQILKLKEIKKDFERSSDHQEKLKLISKEINDLYKRHSEKRTQFQKNVMNEKYSTSDVEKLYLDYLTDNQEYNKLRTIMDYWCSLWFWKPEKIDLFPSVKEYIVDIENIIEKNEAGFKRSSIVKNVISSVPFFHFDLEYPEVFSKGGFDLVLGNPPWAQLSWSDMDFFSDSDHSYLVNEIEKVDEKKLFEKDLKDESVQKKYKDGLVLVEGIRNFLSQSGTYPYRDQSKTNTYKFFWQRSHVVTKSNGTYGLIKQGGILSDKGTDELRPSYYNEVSKLYRFINEKRLFEVHNLVEYVVAIFKKGKDSIGFKLIDNLYHPITIERCKKASSRDVYPGNKDDDGNFDLNGHPDRIVTISGNTLRELTILDGKQSAEFLTVTLPNIHGVPEWKLIKKAIVASEQLGGKDFYWTTMFDETAAQRKGHIETWTKAHKDIAHAILTGPNIDVGNPFYKQPNLGCKNNRDYSDIDLNEISENFFPASKYRITKKGESSSEYFDEKNSIFRIFHRVMVSTTGSRTLCSAIYPPQVGHINGVGSLSLGTPYETVLLQSLFSSIIYDFFSRNLSTGNLTTTFLNKLPFYSNEKINDELMLRVLRLNCLSNHYDELWKNCFKIEMKSSPSLSDYSPSTSNLKLTKNWNYNSPLRDEKEREQALCESDALVAMLMGVSSDELVKLYRSQFGALQKKLKDLPGQNEEDSFPRAKLMADAYQMFLKHFGVTEKQVVEGYFQKETPKKSKVA